MTKDQIKLLKDEYYKDDGTGNPIPYSTTFVFDNGIVYNNTDDFVIFDKTNELIHRIFANVEDPVIAAEAPFKIGSNTYDSLQYVEAMLTKKGLETVIDDLFLNTGLIKAEMKAQILEWASTIQNVVPSEDNTPYFGTAPVVTPANPLVGYYSNLDKDTRTDGIDRASAENMQTAKDKLHERVEDTLSRLNGFEKTAPGEYVAKNPEGEDAGNGPGEDGEGESEVTTDTDSAETAESEISDPTPAEPETPPVVVESSDAAEVATLLYNAFSDLKDTGSTGEIAVDNVLVSKFETGSESKKFTKDDDEDAWCNWFDKNLKTGDSIVVRFQAKNMPIREDVTIKIAGKNHILTQKEFESWVRYCLIHNSNKTLQSGAWTVKYEDGILKHTRKIPSATAIPPATLAQTMREFPFKYIFRDKYTEISITDIYNGRSMCMTNPANNLYTYSVMIGKFVPSVIEEYVGIENPTVNYVLRVGSLVNPDLIPVDIPVEVSYTFKPIPKKPTFYDKVDEWIATIDPTLLSCTKKDNGEFMLVAHKDLTYKTFGLADFLMGTEEINSITCAYNNDKIVFCDTITKENIKALCNGIRDNIPSDNTYDETYGTVEVMIGKETYIFDYRASCDAEPAKLDCIETEMRNYLNNVYGVLGNKEYVNVYRENDTFYYTFHKYNSKVIDAFDTGIARAIAKMSPTRRSRVITTSLTIGETTTEYKDFALDGIAFRGIYKYLKGIRDAFCEAAPKSKAYDPVTATFTINASTGNLIDNGAFSKTYTLVFMNDAEDVAPEIDTNEVPSKLIIPFEPQNKIQQAYYNWLKGFGTNASIYPELKELVPFFTNPGTTDTTFVFHTADTTCGISEYSSITATLANTIGQFTAEIICNGKTAEYKNFVAATLPWLPSTLEGFREGVLADLPWHSGIDPIEKTIVIHAKDDDGNDISETFNFRFESALYASQDQLKDHITEAFFNWVTKFGIDGYPKGNEIAYKLESDGTHTFTFRKYMHEISTAADIAHGIDRVFGSIRGIDGTNYNLLKCYLGINGSTPTLLATSSINVGTKFKPSYIPTVVGLRDAILNAAPNQITDDPVNIYIKVEAPMLNLNNKIYSAEFNIVLKNSCDVYVVDPEAIMEDIFAEYIGKDTDEFHVYDGYKSFDYELFVETTRYHINLKLDPTRYPIPYTYINNMLKKIDLPERTEWSLDFCNTAINSRGVYIPTGVSFTKNDIDNEESITKKLAEFFKDKSIFNLRGELIKLHCHDIIGDVVFEAIRYYSITFPQYDEYYDRYTSTFNSLYDLDARKTAVAAVDPVTKEVIIDFHKYGSHFERLGNTNSNTNTNFYYSHSGLSLIKEIDTRVNYSYCYFTGVVDVTVNGVKTTHTAAANGYHESLSAAVEPYLPKTNRDPAVRIRLDFHKHMPQNHAIQEEVIESWYVTFRNDYDPIVYQNDNRIGAMVTEYINMLNTFWYLNNDYNNYGLEVIDASANKFKIIFHTQDNVTTYLPNKPINVSDFRCFIKSISDYMVELNGANAKASITTDDGVKTDYIAKQVTENGDTYYSMAEFVDAIRAIAPAYKYLPDTHAIITLYDTNSDGNEYSENYDLVFTNTKFHTITEEEQDNVIREAFEEFSQIDNDIITVTKQNNDIYDLKITRHVNYNYEDPSTYTFALYDAIKKLSAINHRDFESTLYVWIKFYYDQHAEDGTTIINGGYDQIYNDILELESWDNEIRRRCRSVFASCYPICRANVGVDNGRIEITLGSTRNIVSTINITLDCDYPIPDTIPIITAETVINEWKAGISPDNATIEDTNDTTITYTFKENADFNTVETEFVDALCNITGLTGITFKIGDNTTTYSAWFGRTDSKELKTERINTALAKLKAVIPEDKTSAFTIVSKITTNFATTELTHIINRL